MFFVLKVYMFRNVPGMQPYYAQQWSSAALQLHQATFESDSLFDHLSFHPNTAPFISQLLIQRLVTSNPSPRYVRTVVEAFNTVTQSLFHAKLEFHSASDFH